MMDCLEYLNQFSQGVDIPSTIIISVFEYLIVTLLNESTAQNLMLYYKVFFFVVKLVASCLLSRFDFVILKVNFYVICLVDFVIF